MEWNETTLQWFVDGNAYHARTQATVRIPSDPFYVILNTAIAWYAPPTPTSPYPVYHHIDYVRAYEPVPQSQLHNNRT